MSELVIRTPPGTIRVPETNIFLDSSNIVDPVEMGRLMSEEGMTGPEAYITTLGPLVRIGQNFEN